MTDRNTDWRWPWYQQVTDALAFLLGVAIAVAMTYRDSYPFWGVALVLACVGKLTTSQILRLLLGRWDAKP